MSARCPLCAAATPVRFVSNGHNVCRCGGCDLEFVWPPPSPEALAEVYGAGYFEGSGAGYEDYFRRERAQVARKSQTRLDALASIGVTSGRLLDVGCAAGFFLDAARSRGFEVHGVERSREARDRADESLHGAIVESLEAVRARGPFDVITLFDALEHFEDPFGALRTLAAMAAPGAAVAVVLPVLGNLNTRLAPHTWDQYKPPEHLWFWSRAAMRETLRVTMHARVVLEQSAWRRDGRFVDPEQRATSAPRRAFAALDRSFGRAVGLFWPALVTDSVAFYARCDKTCA